MHNAIERKDYLPVYCPKCNKIAFKASPNYHKTIKGTCVVKSNDEVHSLRMQCPECMTEIGVDEIEEGVA